MKFTAVGDIIIQKRIFEGYEGFSELAPFIREGDARFFNLETTLNHEGETCASQFSGGTYLRTNPEVLDDLRGFGFNMTSFNNNHVLDFWYDGFKCTLDAVKKSGLVHSGAGMNLAEASAPKYLETKNGRVALISVSTSFGASAMAGEQTARVPGRPGINGLRVGSYVELPREDLDYIKKIADKTKINVETEIIRKEGYYAELADDEAEFGSMKFKLGDTARVVKTINKEDIARVDKAIYEAKLQADYIMISIHSHGLAGDAKENPSEYLIDFAHHCIDEGANAIVGHGPHLLRPIEVYKDCPIFYSLGDFVLQLYDIEFAPEDFFAKHGLHAHSSTVHELLKKRSKDFTVGLMTDPRMFRAVIPLWETEGGKLTKLTLMPVEMSMDGNRSEQGLPRRSKNPEIAEYLAKMCEPFGTKIKMKKDGLITCEW
ncbi:MAG: CapA family protein [Oscillospiraceae bacterium]|nr:CapA family protein [Oscillospiraceae bacterium]